MDTRQQHNKVVSTDEWYTPEEFRQLPDGTWKVKDEVD